MNFNDHVLEILISKIFSINTQEYCVCWTKIFLIFIDHSFPFWTGYDFPTLKLSWKMNRLI